MLGVLHAVGLAVGHDDRGVVQKPVEDADRGGLLGQESTPLLERPVRADGQGAAFESPVSLYTAGPVLADRIGVVVLGRCDS